MITRMMKVAQAISTALLERGHEAIGIFACWGGCAWCWSGHGLYFPLMIDIEVIVSGRSVLNRPGDARRYG